MNIGVEVGLNAQSAAFTGAIATKNAPDAHKSLRAWAQTGRLPALAPYIHHASHVILSAVMWKLRSMPRRVLRWLPPGADEAWAQRLERLAIVTSVKYGSK